MLPVLILPTSFVLPVQSSFCNLSRYRATDRYRHDAAGELELLKSIFGTVASHPDRMNRSTARPSCHWNLANLPGCRRRSQRPS